MSNNAVFDYMLEHEGPITVERFIELNWFGEKTLADLSKTRFTQPNGMLVP